MGLHESNCNTLVKKNIMSKENSKKESSGLEQFQRLAEKEERSHFEDLDVAPKCNHPEHEPPTHLHIPFGKKYVHICPGCKRRIELIPPQISF